MNKIVENRRTEKRKPWDKKYRETHKQQISEYFRKWAAANKERRRAYYLQRKAKGLK